MQGETLKFVLSDCLTLDYGTGRLSWNVGSYQPTSLSHLGRAKTLNCVVFHRRKLSVCSLWNC